LQTPDSENINPVELAAGIVAAFVSHNSLPVAELPALIASVDAALRRLATGAPAAAPVEEKPEPAVSVRKSITPDYLVCLDDGKKFKSLRRHLATLGMTPDDYRTKWGLPADYPMVAPNYAAQRSNLAKQMGLGQARKKAAPARAGRKPKASA
jgi:predicted transcriptional regulator